MNKRNVGAAARRFISKDPSRPALQKAIVQVINGIKYYGYCDGFRLAWSPIDFGYGVTDNPFHWETIALDRPRNNKPCFLPFDTDEKAELKRYIKEVWNNERTPFELSDPNSGYTILVNPRYLKDALDFTGADTIEINLNSDTGPIFLHGADDRHALVLPIRK